MVQWTLSEFDSKSNHVSGRVSWVKLLRRCGADHHEEQSCHVFDFTKTYKNRERVFFFFLLKGIHKGEADCSGFMTGKCLLDGRTGRSVASIPRIRAKIRSFDSRLQSHSKELDSW